jgi:hypothetical protein
VNLTQKTGELVENQRFYRDIKHFVFVFFGISRFFCKSASYVFNKILISGLLCAGLRRIGRRTAPLAPGLLTMAANDEASNGDDQQSGLKRKVAQNRR